MLEVSFGIFVALLVVVGLIGFGFWMGRRTLTLPVDVAKAFDPGKPVVREYDPYDEAMTGDKFVVEDVR